MAKTYDIVGMWSHLGDATKAEYLRNSSDADLQKWASDPNCNQQVICAVALKRRAGNVDVIAAKPFDHRTEVSADAKHIAGRIITHMWIIFVALPFVLALVFVLLTSK